MYLKLEIILCAKWQSLNLAIHLYSFYQSNLLREANLVSKNGLYPQLWNCPISFKDRILTSKHTWNTETKKIILILVWMFRMLLLPCWLLAWPLFPDCCLFAARLAGGSPPSLGAGSSHSVLRAGSSRAGLWCGYTGHDVVLVDTLSLYFATFYVWKFTRMSNDIFKPPACW